MTVIGIDLGTTNSACGVWRDEKAELIPNRLGEMLTPSVVGLDDKGELIIGRAAKERLINHSDKTVAAFKRLMGTDHKVQLGRQQMTAIELSALILKALKEDAEAYLGESVTEAVISVPAYFNDNQRQATKQAGELAGLKVERLINEPTAAAVAYGLHEKQEGTFLILDMGGGTFDVSILEFFDGVMEVHASAGDNFLGGEDFVAAMMDALLKELGVDRKELSAKQSQNIYMQLETLKRRIGQQEEHTLELTIGKDSVSWVATQEWFIKVISPLLLRAKRPIERAVKDSGLSIGAIDEVVLVGGSTRLAAFRSLVGKMFGRLPACHLDPDTVVAIGATIQAALKSRDSALDDVVLTDVCPYTLGMGIINRDAPDKGDYFLPIVERNAVVPTSFVKRVYTTYDNQASVLIRIFQGESRFVEKNVFLGEVSVDVPKAGEGEESIDVRYSYDMNGLLEVDVKVVSTGKALNKVIEHSPGALSEADIQRSREKLAALKFHPREVAENVAILARGERLFETSLGEDRDYIADLLKQFERVLDTQNAVEIKKAQARVTEILDQLDGEEWI